MMTIKHLKVCVVVNVVECDMLVGEFEHQSRYCIHFQTDTLEKGMNLLILPAMCYIVLLLFFFKDGFSINLPTKVDMLLK